VKANVVGDELVIEAIPYIEELLERTSVIPTTMRKIEEASEQLQKGEGIYG
jgi:hypothetical protein